MKIESYSPTIRRKEMDSVLTAMVQERVGPGQISAKFVQLAKEFINFEYCIALRSPASALYFALKALEISPGDSIMISALSPFYYISVLDSLGLHPVFMDVDESTYLPNLQLSQSSVTPQVRAIILNHSLGFVPDTPSFLELNIPIIEDCSRSFGTNWLDRRAGSYGAFTIMGLEESDIVTAGGGSLLYAHGKREGIVLKKYLDLPNEYFLPDLNASLAIVQIKESERNFEKRKEIASVYAQSALRTRHRRPIQIGDCEYNNFAFPLSLDTGTKDVISYAVKKDVAVEAAFADTIVGMAPEGIKSCPISTSLMLRTVLFPLYPRLGKTQVSRIAKVLATLP